MYVTIEVANEVGGMASVKRTVLISESFPGSADLEAAAITFIRESRAANEEALGSYFPAIGDQMMASGE
jgi:hypothetical protein